MGTAASRYEGLRLAAFIFYFERPLEDIACEVIKAGTGRLAGSNGFGALFAVINKPCRFWIETASARVSGIAGKLAPICIRGQAVAVC